MLDKEDIEQLKSIVLDSDILILSDEVYEHIIFDGKTHESILKYPELAGQEFCYVFHSEKYTIAQAGKWAIV